MAELEIRPTAAMRGRVGAVILSAFVVTGVLVWLLTDGGSGLFSAKADIRTYMPDATGIAVQSPVRLDGIQVGVVKNVAISGYLDRQRAVRVELRLETAYFPRIPADSLTSIGSDTMIGDKFLDIAAGKNPRTVAAGGELPSEPADTAADKADLVLGLQDSLRKVDSLLQQVASPDTQVGHWVLGEKEYDQILSSVAVFERSLRVFAAKDQPAGEMVFTNNLYNKLNNQLKSFNDMLTGIQKGEGVAGKLYASDEQYNSMVKSLTDLRKTMQQMRSDMEKTGAGLPDDAAYNNLRRMLASSDAMMAALNRGEGTAGELLRNPQLYESLVGSLQSMQALLKDFDSNPRKYLRLKLF